MLAKALASTAKAVEPAYIEDVFSTYLYTGNGSTQTITNGIDLSTKGGLVWLKGRNTAGTEHELTDTARGTGANGNALNSNDAQAAQLGDLTSFTSSGFGLSYNTANGNASGTNYVSWTFRKQPKFFDVVTYTGNGSGAGITVAHSLASQPGTVIMKRTDSTSNWMVMHRTDSVTYKLLRLNTTDANLLNVDGTYYTSTSFVAYQFNQDTGVAADNMNVNGATYVAYLFAHNAGGFGLSGTDNVISCGSFTTDSSGNATVNLGYEPQFLIQRMSENVDDWYMLDIMRGSPQPYIVGVNNQKMLKPNTSAAEADTNGRFNPNSTGFTVHGLSGSSVYIYIAIRRGPMKVPTSGTSVFSPQYSVGTTGQQITTSFPVDLQWFEYLPGGGNNYSVDRLRGVSTNSTETNQTRALFLNGSGTEAASNVTRFWNNTGYQQPSFGNVANGYINWNFRRAPSFFDVVCYTGTGAYTNVTHNLGVAPEFWIVKRRNATTAPGWAVGSTQIPASQYLVLNSTAAVATGSSYWDGTYPTSTTFRVGLNSAVNELGATYVAYLFATCPGVSKVGSYTGTGTTKQIDCGFTGGARFVLIKRTDDVGDWYVWDSARGIVAGNDPYLLLNSTAAEVTSTDYIDTYSAGFEISSTAPAAINANGGTYIFLAIA